MKLKSLLHYINNARSQVQSASEDLTKAANELLENGHRSEEDLIEDVETYLTRSKQLIEDALNKINRHYHTNSLELALDKIDEHLRYAVFQSLF